MVMLESTPSTSLHSLQRPQLTVALKVTSSPLVLLLTPSLQADAITNTSGNDVITAGTGADTVTLVGVVGGVASNETINQGLSDSVAATVAWTQVANNGTLTEDGSAIVFGNGIDTVNGFATTVDDVDVSGTVSAWQSIQL